MSDAALGGLRPDLDTIVDRCGAAWDRLDGARILVTGGTGYVGRWIAAAIDHAHRRLGLDCRLTIVSRRPASLRGACPFLADSPAIDTVAADVRTMPFPDGRISHVIHAATPVERQASTPDAEMIGVCEEGTRRVMAVAAAAGSAAVLVASSGAVYGTRPPDGAPIPESYVGGGEPSSAYAEGKRRSERIAADAARSGLPTCIVRLFAQAGPHLPLEGQFALGNFVRDAVAGRDIVVRGDGTPVRTYLYATDLVEWLLTLLTRGCRTGDPGCFNVGSEEAISIAAVAHLVAETDRRVAGKTTAARVVIEGDAVPGAAATRYVPDCSRARDAFGLVARVPVAVSVARMLEWHRRGTVPQHEPEESRVP